MVSGQAALWGFRLDRICSIPVAEIEPTDSDSTRWERWLRRFDNFLVARDIVTDARQKEMLLHYAGEAVFDLSEAVGVIPTDNFDATKLKLTAYFTPRRNEEYEVFTFRQTQQKSGKRLTSFTQGYNRCPKTVALRTKIVK